MLEEAILNLKAGVVEPVADRWSPQITVGNACADFRKSMLPTSLCGCRCTGGSPISIPTTRSTISPPSLRDRFGVLPDRGALSLQDRRHQRLLPPRQCREGRCRSERCGHHLPPTTSSRRPDRLVYFIPSAWSGGEGSGTDMKVVFFQQWETPEERLMWHDRSPCASLPTSPRTRKQRSFELTREPTGRRNDKRKTAAGIAADGRFSIN